MGAGMGMGAGAGMGTGTGAGVGIGTGAGVGGDWAIGSTTDFAIGCGRSIGMYIGRGRGICIGRAIGSQAAIPRALVCARVEHSHRGLCALLALGLVRVYYYAIASESSFLRISFSIGFNSGSSSLA